MLESQNFKLYLQHNNYRGWYKKIGLNECLERYSKEKCRPHNFDKLVHFVYGWSEIDSEELRLAKCLTAWYMLYYFRKTFSHEKWKHQTTEKNIWSAWNEIKKCFPSFEVQIGQNWEPPRFKSKIYKSVSKNINDINPDQRQPINIIFGTVQSNDELRGAMSRIYSELENSQLKSQNQCDNALYSQTLKLLKFYCNQVGAIKGHKGKSQLKVRDVAYSVAFLGSVLYKLKAIYGLTFE